jgi:hypothetical protein
MPVQFLPYALAAYGGYKGYKGAKDSGASGLQRILAGAARCLWWYNLGQVGGFAKGAGFGNAASANFVPTFSNLPGVSYLPSMGGAQDPSTMSKFLGVGKDGSMIPNPNYIQQNNRVEIYFRYFKKTKRKLLQVTGIQPWKSFRCNCCRKLFRWCF